MSASQFSVFLCDPFGVRLADASNFVKLQYTRVVNDVGALKIWLPASFDTRLIRIPDGRIEVWRSIPGTVNEVLETETTWLIKALEYDRDREGNVVILVEADSPLAVCRERISDYPATSGQNEANDAADNVLKQLFKYNCGENVTGTSIFPAGEPVTARNVSALISVPPELSQGPTIRRSYAFKNVLLIMQDVAQASADAGVYVAFDIVAPLPHTLEFRTYLYQRGVDHRFPGGVNPVIFGADFGNVGESVMRLDYRKEVTFARGGGAGQAFNRIFGSAWDIVRINASPFGRREAFVQATQETTVTGCNNAAAASVRGGRPRLTYKGRILDTPETRYGVHWAWGDVVTVQDFGQQFDCRVDAVTVTIDDDEETIDAWVRND